MQKSEAEAVAHAVPDGKAAIRGLLMRRLRSKDASLRQLRWCFQPQLGLQCSLRTGGAGLVLVERGRKGSASSTAGNRKNRIQPGEGSVCLHNQIVCTVTGETGTTVKWRTEEKQ